MVSRITLCAIILMMTSVIFSGEPQYVDTVGHIDSGAPIEATPDLVTPPTVIQVARPSVDIPDIDFIREQLKFNLGNMRGIVKIKWKPESFFGRNINLLNNGIDEDFIYYSRSTFDTSVGLQYGEKCYGLDVLEFAATMRSKAVWGNAAASLATADEEVKFGDGFLPAHRHTFNRQLLWMREVWLRFSINAVLGQSDNWATQHTFTIGSFPFQLGRGIALGSAYAVNAGPLGFYSDNSIDQFAYGCLLNGEIVVDALTYDLYGEIISNFSDSLKANQAPIYRHRKDRKDNPQRGAGHVDYLIAGRLKWVPLDTDFSSVSFEPYAFYNRMPEHKLEFTGDSEGRLITTGLAGEFTAGNFACGFDTAFNIGSQQVHGWDRNRPRPHNQGGTVVLINTQVVTEDPEVNPKANKELFIPDTANQNAIDAVPIDAALNGQPIPNTTPELWNSLHRFRNPYHNKLRGWMFVADAAYTFTDYDLLLAVEGGVASGDEDPNKDLRAPGDARVDHTYRGFIPLQEIYSGNYVKSVFLLGGSGKVSRPLTSPVGSVIDSTPSIITSTFNNIIYIGSGANYTPTDACRYFSVRPNIIAYWLEHPTKAFDRITNQTLYHRDAHRYLGTELNCFMDVGLLKDFNFFAVGSIFIPGEHFKDIKGKPLDATQQKILANAVKENRNRDKLPLLGNDVAWTLNLGLEARF